MVKPKLILEIEPELKAEVFRAARETRQSASRDAPERQPVHARGVARRGGPGPCAP